MKAAFVLAALGAASFATSSACTEFAELPAGQCGNGVIEGDNEECDRPGGVGCGAAGTAAACRLTCDLATAVACPDGYVCGGDQVCRQASGQFALSASVASEGFDVLVAHADDDGRADLYDLGFDRVVVHAGDGAGGFAPGLAYPTRPSFGAPTLGDLNEDGLGDVIGPAGLGLQTLLSNGAGGLESYVYFTLELAGLAVLPLGLDIGPAGSPYQALVLAFDDKISVLNAGELSVPGLRIAAIPERHVPVAFLERGRGTALDAQQEMVVAQLGASQVTVYAVNGLGVPRQGATVPLPPGATVSGRIDLAFTDADHCHDLVIAATRAGPMAGVDGLVFARGVPAGAGCTGGFGPAVFAPNPATVLAIADFNRDGIDDVVGTLGTYVSCVEPACECPGVDTQCEQLAAITFTGWQGAVAGDFNHDGCLDFVAADAGLPRLDVRVGTCGQVFNQFTLPVQSSPRQLVAGDFDGDRIDDVALLLDGSDPRGEQVAELALTYGRAEGSLLAPTTLASFRDVESMSAARIVTGADTTDGIDDLLLVGSRCSDPQCEPPVRGLAVMTGASSRSMSSPLVLTPNSTVNADEPLAALIGQFDDTPGNDVLAVTIPDRSTGPNQAAPYRLWALRGDERGNLTEAGRLQVESPGFEPLRARFARAELDGDGLDEVVGIDTRLDPSGGGDALSALVRVDASASGVVANLEPITTAATAPADALLNPLAIESRDLDGDGRSELLVTFTGPEERAMPGGEEARPALALLRAGPTGPIAVEVLDRADDDHGCTAAAGIQLDADPALEIIAVCVLLAADGPSSVWRVFQAGADGRYQAAGDQPRDASAPGVLQLEVGDLDGDGLEDLVALEYQLDGVPRAQVYRQLDTYGGGGIVVGGGR